MALPSRSRRIAYSLLMLALAAVIVIGRFLGDDLQAWYRTIDPVLARLIGGGIVLVIGVGALALVIYAYRRPKV